MEEAVRIAVKQSVAGIARVLIGDKRAELVPLFSVTLVLETNHRIELKPTVQVSAA